MTSFQTRQKRQPAKQSEIRLWKLKSVSRRNKCAESVPRADRWTESNSGSEDGHPRDVENTWRNKATEGRDI